MKSNSTNFRTGAAHAVRHLFPLLRSGLPPPARGRGRGGGRHARPLLRGAAGPHPRGVHPSYSHLWAHRFSLRPPLASHRLTVLQKQTLHVEIGAGQKFLNNQSTHVWKECLRWFVNDLGYVFSIKCHFHAWVFAILYRSRRFILMPGNCISKGLHARRNKVPATVCSCESDKK